MQRRIFIILIVYFACACGCKKTNSSATPFTSGYHVYISGIVDNNAVYWDNGKQIDLDLRASTSGIAVKDKDVYVSGTLIVGNSGMQALYWKNGVEIPLPGLNANVTGIALSGNDVYCVGYTYSDTILSGSADYWKNGVMNYIDTFKSAEALSIAFSGSDMYTTGYIDQLGIDSVICWKNGLTTTYSIEGGMYYTVAVNGSDVYIVGYLKSGVAGYFKNSVPTYFPQGAGVSSIAFSGTDVYIGGLVGGGSDTKAAYWKNGVQTMLKNDYLASSVTAMVVAGQDIYAIGFVYDGSNDIPVYWKNGVLTKLADRGRPTAACAAKD